MPYLDAYNKQNNNDIAEEPKLLMDNEISGNLRLSNMVIININ